MTAASYGNLPKLTVIMIVRNAVGTVSRALDSLAAQHYPKLELIIWDGVSTDGTLESLARYDDLITRLVSEKDDGPPDACNKAFGLSTGDFIGLLNSDDEMEPGMLWAVAEAILHDPQADVISTGMLHRKINRKGQGVVTGYYAGEDQLAPTLENVLSELPTFVMSRYIRRDLKVKVGPFNTNKEYCYISNDREWMARLALTPCRNIVIPRALYGFYIHSQNLSLNKDSFHAIIEEHLHIAEALLKRDDLSQHQRDVVVRWQGRQLVHGFIKSLMQLQLPRARAFLGQGIAHSGWRFLPRILWMFFERIAHRLGLALCNGIDRG